MTKPTDLIPGEVFVDDFDTKLACLIRDCECDACRRYRRYYEALVAEYTEKLARSLGLLRVEPV